MRSLLETPRNRQNQLLHAHFTKLGRESLMFSTIKSLKLAKCLAFDIVHVRLFCFVQQQGYTRKDTPKCHT